MFKTAGKFYGDLMRNDLQVWIFYYALSLPQSCLHKVLSTVKKTEGMRATRRRRSTLKSQLPLWWPLPRSLMDTGANHLSLVKNICVCTSCVLSGAVSATKGFGGVSHDFRCILSFVGCKTSHGIAYRLRVSPLPEFDLSSATPEPCEPVEWV